jgi:outer membrane protein assembly factor BamA
VFLIVLSGLFSQELPDNNKNNITGISISGLRRTKPYVVERTLQKFIGHDAESVDINEVIAILKRTGIIEPLTVEIKDNEGGNGKLLAIVLREKWSVFPIPFFSINSGGWSAGGAFIDANAFGVKDNMMVMGFYGTGGWMLNAMYINTPNAVGDFGWNIMGLFSFENKENVDQKGERVLKRFNSILVAPSIGLSYKFTELITSRFNVSYKNIMLQDTEDPINAPSNGVQTVTVSPSVSIQTDSWDSYFLNGVSASLRYSYVFVIGEDDVNSVSLNASLNKSVVPSLIPGLRLTAKSGIVFATSSASPFFESSPMNAAVNILPQKYSAVDFAGASLGLEKFLFKFSFGTVAVSAAYQVVYSNSNLLHNQFDHGAVAMIQMYFSKLAIPGAGLGAAYNVDKNVWQYAFNIGMMF